MNVKHYGHTDIARIKYTRVPKNLACGVPGLWEAEAAGLFES